MDADTRHQLRQNELATALQKLRTLERDRYMPWIIGLAVLLVAVIGFRWWRSSSAASVASDWRELIAVNFTAEGIPGAAEQLRHLISSGADPTVTAAARLRLGANLIGAADEHPSGREAALKEAADVLRPLVQDKSLPVPLLAASAYALGCAEENLGHFDEAKAAYKLLIDDPRFDVSPFKGMATERHDTVDELRRPIVLMPGSPPVPPPASAPAATAPGELIAAPSTVTTAPASPLESGSEQP